MRLLLDESLPRRLRTHFASHDVSTVGDMGWLGVKNGELLRLAGLNFDAFITPDRNLRYQQNLSTVPVSVVVVVAPSNELAALLPLVPAIERVLDSLQPRGLIEVGG